MEIYTREAQLDILKEKRMEMDKFFIYEMHRAVGTEGENDIAKAARDAQRAFYNFELTLRNYHNG